MIVAKTRVKMDFELSEEFEVEVGMLQWSVLMPFMFAGVVGVVTELARDGWLIGLMYVDDLVLMSETIEGLMNKFIEWEEAFESMGLKVKLCNA